MDRQMERQTYIGTCLVAVATEKRNLKVLETFLKLIKSLISFKRLLSLQIII